MEAATKERELSGEKAQRIIDAMRESVAKRGAAGSTFEHVAREAGVSRGLLHYYFGTKERLLVEVVRRDAEIRVARLDEPRARAAGVADVIAVLVPNLTALIENEPAFFLLLYELFSAGRRNPDIQHEVGQLLDRTRSHVAEILEAKEREGVLKLRYGAEAIVAHLFAVGDGVALQALSETGRRIEAPREAGAASAVYLLAGEGSPSQIAPSGCERLADQPMHDAMLKLAGLLARRRRLVVAVWALLLPAALPLAARQTEPLTGGGFDVPGSESKSVADSMQGVFAGRSNGVAVLLRAEPGAGDAERAAAVLRVRDEVAAVDGIALSPAAARSEEP